MKITAIGDIHGRDLWKKIIDKESDSDMFVFVGDYVDTHENINGFKQLENLKEILRFKRDNPEKVRLLIGNHDYHYFPKPIVWGLYYSGFQGHMIPDFREYLSSAYNDGMIQPCYVHEDLLFVHAGVSKTWCQTYDVDQSDLEHSLDDLFYTKISAFDFQIDPDTDRGWSNPYGDNIFQSPLWIRPKSLLEDKIDGYRQIVGHTQMKSIGLEASVKFIDTLEVGQYLIYENNKFKIGTSHG